MLGWKVWELEETGGVADSFEAWRAAARRSVRFILDGPFFISGASENCGRDLRSN
jgi:hypothetical protein